ncbi:flagellar biosynthetic protein FliR [Niallia endozanthoxylica]|uniref:Flagellar biosynthetic protein FliR n=1 Tax=Niallia endozanthoxylica TaxID=2036016 RepID=A0A5J5HXN7_9BACI|nr:flagellar biosynthetic protein FliR [Niallia endozanthoxylica]KAA9025862.1 flagellar type III secretion system protein FliR [Niallia endozanthoxylica]
MVNLFETFPAFLLVFVRVTSFFLMMPLFSYRTVSTTFKVGFGFFLALIMFFNIKAPALEMDGVYYLLILKEALIGILLGFMAYLVMSAIQIAGGFIDFQMGFGMVNVMDPQTGAQSPLMGQYLNIISLFFLLMVNGHHLMIDGIYYSYQFIPLEQAWLPLGSEHLLQYILKSFSTMFMIALQMSLPVVGSLFLVDVALGITARTFPQLNIFVVGVPLKIGVSFLILMIVMGTMMISVSNLFKLMLTTMRGIMNLLGGL